MYNIMRYKTLYLGYIMTVKKSIRLECSECNEINYLTFKNAKKHPEKLELNKYCSRCQSTKKHKETKKK